MRWLTGWDQVTLRHVSTIYKTRSLHPCKKLGLTYLLPMRWVLLTLALVNSFAFPIIKFGMGLDPLMFSWPIVLCFNFGFMSLLTILIVATISACLYDYRRPAQIFFVMLFITCSLLYLIWQLFLMCFSISRICFGRDGEWVVTERAVAKPKQPDGAAAAKALV